MSGRPSGRTGCSVGWCRTSSGGCGRCARSSSPKESRMPTLMSGMNRPLLVRVPGRKPSVIAAMESVWPSRTLVIPPQVPFQVSDGDLAVILESQGYQGLVEASEAALDEALIEAKSKRMQFLDYFINQFREENARSRAEGAGILMPKKVHRDALKELKKLQEELSTIDAELLGEPTRRALKRETVEDVATKELTAFGITPGTAPLVPEGMPLTDFEGS